MSLAKELDDLFANISAELQQKFGNKLNKEQLAKCAEKLEGNMKKKNIDGWTDTKLMAKLDIIADVLVGETKEDCETMQPKTKVFRDLQEMPLDEIGKVNKKILDLSIKIKTLNDKQQNIIENNKALDDLQGALP